MLVLNKIT